MLLIGDGIIAQAIALLLKDSPYALTWIRNDHTPPTSNRLFALQESSQACLEHMHIWPQLHAFPYDGMRVFTTSPPSELAIHAGDIPMPYLGTMVEERHLREALRAALADATSPVYGTLERLAFEQDEWVCDVMTETGKSRYHSGHVLLTERSHQTLALSHGAQYQHHDYQQLAVAGWLDLHQSHQGEARQWFHEGQVLGLLPYTDQRAGFVWSTDPTWTYQGDDQLLSDLNTLTQGRLSGACITEHTTFPLMASQIQRAQGPRGLIALGEAAHTVHPMAGLGLNISLRDVWTLYECLHTDGDLRVWRAPYDATWAQTYKQRRHIEQQLITSTIHGLHTLFHGQHPLMKRSVGLGMQLVDRCDGLKKAMVDLVRGQTHPGLTTIFTTAGKWL